MVERIQSPKPVLVKTTTVRKTGAVHNFFENMKYMEMGAIGSGSLRNSNDGEWHVFVRIIPNEDGSI